MCTCMLKYAPRSLFVILFSFFLDRDTCEWVFNHKIIYLFMRVHFLGMHTALLDLIYVLSHKSFSFHIKTYT